MKNLLMGLSLGLLLTPVATFAATNLTLDQRVANLEAQVARLQARAVLKPGPDPSLSAADVQNLTKQHDALIAQYNANRASRYPDYIINNALVDQIQALDKKLGTSEGLCYYSRINGGGGWGQSCGG